MSMKITMNEWCVLLVLACFLAIAQLGAADRTIIRQFTDDAQKTNEETAAQWFRRLPHAKRGFQNLHFYIVDNLTGANATAFPVAKASITEKSPVKFGQVTVFDSPLLDGPDSTTAAEIGRGQGLDARDGLDEATALFAVTFLFKRIYRGSTISILGRVKQDDTVVREFSVVGGTGVFRGAQGTATVTTASVEPRVLDCNLYFEYYL